MDRNLSWKVVLIVVLVALAAWTLYPPDMTLKPGIDLGGGTSLIYEIDAHGMTADERRGLAARMISVLRRRIDPANIQNLVWRPQGNTRFEIQMPLASKEARDKRQVYENTLTDLLSSNVTTAAILRSVEKPADQRTKDFAIFAHDSNQRTQVLDDFAKAYDERKDLQQQRDNFAGQMTEPENKIKQAGIDLDDVKAEAAAWLKLDKDKLKDTITAFLSTQSSAAGSLQANLDLLTQYTELYGKWAAIVDKLTDPENGANYKYNLALQNLNKLNLSEDQVTTLLDTAPPKSTKKAQAIKEVITQFPEREKQIVAVEKAYDEYYPFRGRLDDPTDLQRMLKGAGILEFRILPTEGSPEVDMAQMKNYVEMLKTKGPRYASDDKYIWIEIEDPKTWHGGITGQFGNKFYVLASNRKDECILHTGQQKEWRLVRASPGQDQMGRRAIDFELDDRGGRLFSNVTGKNLERPLCILLDNMALSAPNILSRIYTRGQITGGSNGYSQTDVEDMVNKLNAGSLPARLVEQPISVRTIGPSIGADNRDKGIKSGLIGLAVVAVFMIVYYTIGGSIADVALLLNILFLLAIMAGLRATFTLPGIAGVILTIGMAVDANVLIFERIREEQAKGASLAIALKNGYEKAFSAIFDSNLTTILTAAILYWVASEEIKGFALTLMLGLASSMFTALFVTRAIFEILMRRGILKDHLVMLHIIKRANINWMKHLPIFLTISGILTIGGLTLFLTRNDVKNNKYDIEFTGGTAVQIDLKPDAKLDRQQVEDLIHKKGDELKDGAIASASVYSVGTTGKQFEINTTATNRTVASVTLPAGKQLTAEQVAAEIQKAAAKSQREIDNLVVTSAGNQSFNIQTSSMNTQLIADVLTQAFPDANVPDPKVNQIVNDAILSAFAGKLEIEENLHPVITSTEKVNETVIEAHPELSDYLGGAVINCELGSPGTGEDISNRFGNLRIKPDLRGMSWYKYKLADTQFKPIDPNALVKSFVYIGTSPEATAGQLNDETFNQFVNGEKTKVTSAMELESSLPQVTQISPSVGKEAKTQALVAAVLSLLVMMIYLAVRFGDMRYGLGGLVTLAHDTTATLGAVMIAAFLSTTVIGQYLLIGNFKIDMAMVGAFLTLLGYSINDTIIIYDRIRENRRKGTLTPQLINDSINACLSRTILTSTTVFFVVFVMYIFGGKGLRGFNYALLFGVVEGTYSSIAISAPILLIRHKMAANKNA